MRNTLLVCMLWVLAGLCVFGLPQRAIADAVRGVDYTLAPNLPRLKTDVLVSEWPDGGIWVTVPGAQVGTWTVESSTYMLDDRGCRSRAISGSRSTMRGWRRTHV